MTDVVTMSDQLYRLAQMRFNVQFLNTVASGSAFNPYAKVVGPSSAFWTADLTFIQMESDDLLELRRFIMKLQGGKVLARLYDKSREDLTGSGGVTSTVNVATSAAAGATSVSLKNLIASQTVSLAGMDMIGIGENLYPVIDPVGSDVSGNATVNLGIPLRQGVATDDAVNLSKPTGLFRVVSGATDLTIGPPVYSQNLTLSFVEEPDVD